MNRHLPLSNGLDDENFGGEYQFPWDKHIRAPRKSKQKTCVTSTVVSSPVVHKKAQQPMMYDVDKGCMVPFE